MRNIFVSKTNRAFWQSMIMAIAALAAIVFASIKAYQLSELYLIVLIHKIKDACGCENMAQFFAMHPDIFRAVILFGVGIGIFIFYSLYKFAKLILQTKKYTEHYLSFASSRHSVKLKAAIKTLDLDKARVIEINASDPIVFCYGFLRPKICISGILVDMLGKKELMAILAHEAHHMANYEPLKIFIVKYFRSMFFFFPGLKTSAKKYLLFSELAADEKASGDAAARSDLASAILKISDQKEGLCQKTGSSLSFFDAGVEERANRLSDETYIPKFKFVDKGLIVGSLGLAAASLLFIFVFSSSTKALEMHNIAGCVSEKNLKNDLFCNSANYQNIGNEDNFHNTLNTGVFQQNSACKAE